MKLELFPLDEVEELASPATDNDVSLDSLAIEVFTDFTRHTPLIIDSSVTAEDAIALMKKTHVRLKFVMDENSHFIGIVSRDDLNSQEIVKRLALENTQREKLMVTDFMQVRRGLKAFDYETLHNATINDVVEALKHYGEQHCLVVDHSMHKIRGIFSSSDIARKLHLDIDIHDRSSFVRIFEAVSR